MRTVLFIGAGISSAVGYPANERLFPVLRRALRAGLLVRDVSPLRLDRRGRDELQRGLERLVPGLARVPDPDLPAITDILSLVEDALASGDPLRAGEGARLRRFHDLLKQALAGLLAAPVPDALERETCERLLRWIQKQGDSLTIISTNYDTGVECEIYRALGLSRIADFVDLGFDWRERGTGRQHMRPKDPMLRIYKLHGSLDLFRCRSCGAIHFIPAGTGFRSDRGVCLCDGREPLDIHIVSPVGARNPATPELRAVRRNALEALRASERWILAGHSLPDDDLTVRSLLVRAADGARRPPQITVVQQGEDAWPRYELLFPECSYETGGIEAFLTRESFEGIAPLFDSDVDTH